MISAIYNATSGEITKIIRSPMDQEGEDAGEGERWIPVDSHVTDISHYVADGVLVEFPPRLDEHHTFNWTTKQWIDPRTLQDYIAANRAKRDALLLACDWTQLPDVPLATKQAWTTYRQALRDITNQPDQLNIVWPTPP